MAQSKPVSNNESVEELPPLSPAAIEARKKVQKMITEMEEEERKRRMTEEKNESQDKSRIIAIDKLMNVQEDLLRFINLRKVKEAEEIERVQRITEDKKHYVHEELLRKAVQKEVARDEEEERARRIEATKDNTSDESKERMKTYDRLVNVQEDLLRHMRTLKANEAFEEARQQRVTEMNKHVVQEQLMHEVHRRQATEASIVEQQRRLDENDHLSNVEIEQRVSVASKLLNVHKEMLSTHEPTKPIPDHHTEQVLEDFKVYMQEQLVRKAHQKEAIDAMEKERDRRLDEIKTSPQLVMSDQKAAVLEEVNRKASAKQAKEMTELTQQSYILAQQREEVQAHAVRKVHQKQVDKAMEKEQKERIGDMEGKPAPVLNPSLKKEIVDHGK